MDNVAVPQLHPLPLHFLAQAYLARDRVDSRHDHGRGRN